MDRSIVQPIKPPSFHQARVESRHVELGAAEKFHFFNKIACERVVAHTSCHRLHGTCRKDLLLPWSSSSCCCGGVTAIKQKQNVRLGPNERRLYVGPVQIRAIVFLVSDFNPLVSCFWGLQSRGELMIRTSSNVGGTKYFSKTEK